jgi:hypothetical protein
MASVIPLTDSQVRTGPGWRDLLLADAATSGEPLAMTLRRLELVGGATSEPLAVGADEAMLYVIQGTGTAHCGDESFPLAAESVVWFSAGDPPLTLTAAESGLEALFGRAPGN